MNLLKSIYKKVFKGSNTPLEKGFLVIFSLLLIFILVLALVVMWPLVILFIFIICFAWGIGKMLEYFFEETASGEGDR